MLALKVRRPFVVGGDGSLIGVVSTFDMLRKRLRRGPNGSEDLSACETFPEPVGSSNQKGRTQCNTRRRLRRGASAERILTASETV